MSLNLYLGVGPAPGGSAGGALTPPVSITGVADVVQFTVKANGTQTANVLEVLSSGGDKNITVGPGSGVIQLNLTDTLRIGSSGNAPTDNAGSAIVLYGGGSINLGNAGVFNWWSNSGISGSPDTGLARSAAGIVKFTNGGSGNGGFLAQLGSSIVGHADTVQLTVKGNATQTNPLFAAQASDGTNYCAVAGSGASYSLNTPVFQSMDGDAVSASALLQIYQGTVHLSSNKQIDWYSGTALGGSADIGLARSAAGIFTASDGSTGIGDYQAKGSLLTTGTLTETNKALARKVVHRYDWTNAMVVALGAATSGDITAFTLPAKTVVTNAYVVITGAGSGVSTLTVALGRTSALYTDYIVASDAKASANTVYGDDSAERGTNLTGYDLPDFTGTTAVKLHFISTGANLDQVTGSTGTVYIETMTMP